MRILSDVETTCQRKTTAALQAGLFVVETKGTAGSYGSSTGTEWPLARAWMKG
jgi:hypothetical protein